MWYTCVALRLRKCESKENDGCKKSASVIRTKASFTLTRSSNAGTRRSEMTTGMHPATMAS